MKTSQSSVYLGGFARSSAVTRTRRRRHQKRVRSLVRVPRRMLEGRFFRSVWVGLTTNAAVCFIPEKTSYC